MARRRTAGSGLQTLPSLYLELLENVGVDRTDLEPDVSCVLGKILVVVDSVPGNLDGHGRGNTGEPMDLGRVFDLLVRITRHSRWGNTLNGCQSCRRPKRAFRSAAAARLLAPQIGLSFPHLHLSSDGGRRRRVLRNRQAKGPAAKTVVYGVEHHVVAIF